MTKLVAPSPRSTGLPPHPEISVVVPSQGRPLSLRWLLDALEAQTLGADRFEIIVCHSGGDRETDRLCASHPLAVRGTLRASAEPAPAAPGANRNRGWRLARAERVAFTDDDCLPRRGWLAQLLARAAEHPTAIVQGRTLPDPAERYLLDLVPHAHTQYIVPPTAYAQTCNILYPRHLLEWMEGFDEGLESGEDTDLAERCRLAGVDHVGAASAIVHHAVHAPPLVRRLRGVWRWRHQPELVRRHPRLRRHYVLRVFWTPAHLWLTVALAGALGVRRRPLLATLAIPWALERLPRHPAVVDPGWDPDTEPFAAGGSALGRLRALLELPGLAVLDLAELAALAWGSVRARTLFL